MPINKQFWLLSLLGLFAMAQAGDDDLAYLREHQGVWQVWLYDVDLASHRRLTDDQIDKTRISWHKSRQKLLVNKNIGELVWIDISSGQQTHLDLPVSDMLDAQLSHDGQWIAFSQMTLDPVMNHNLWRVRVDGSGLEQLTNQADFQIFPSWSADDNVITYSSGTQLGLQELWQLEIESGSQTQITLDSKFNYDPAISLENELVYSTNLSGNYDIWLKSDQQSSALQITKNQDYEGEPAWSPNGLQIAYVSLTGGTKQIWIMSSQGKDPVSITPDTVSSRAPAWAH